MTGTFPKNAGSTFFSGSQKARPPCGIPRRSFHFFGPSGFPWASQAVRGVLQDPRKFPRIVRKLGENAGSRVHRLPVFALILRSWPTSRLTRYTARNARALRARFARALRARARPGCRGRFPGSTKLSQDRTETRIKLKVLGGLVARSGVFFAPPEKFTFMAAPRGSYSERLVCQNFESFLQKFSFVPKR